MLKWKILPLVCRGLRQHRFGGGALTCYNNNGLSTTANLNKDKKDKDKDKKIEDELPETMFKSTDGKAYTSDAARLSPILEAGLNDQIVLELSSALLYFGMTAWFSRPDVGLPGMAEYFCRNFDEEIRHAKQLSRYQVRRLGTTRISTFPEERSPTLQQEWWASPLDAMESAVAQEERLLQNLRRLVRAAEQDGERHFADFIVSNFIDEQLEDIADKLQMCTQLRRVGNGDGLSVYDRSLRKKCSEATDSCSDKEDDEKK